MKHIFILFIQFYQRFISPALGSNCRFYPTCSQYMIESIQNCGVLKGLSYGVWRILRCNPYSKGGEDMPHLCGTATKHITEVNK